MPEVQFDKVLHIFLYLPFGFLVARGIGGTKPLISARNCWILVVLATFLYGVSDEYHQSLVPGRTAGIFDLMADTIGGAIGGYICLLRRNKTNVSK